MNKLVEALPDLLKKQAELDNYIMETKGLTHGETIENRKLAFVVELAECMQEWRGFKYWSDNQAPNTSAEIECSRCNGSGLRNPNAILGVVCDDCKGEGVVIKSLENPLLQEYVDTLHFALSLHNYYEGDLRHVRHNVEVVEKHWDKDSGDVAEGIVNGLQILIANFSSQIFWNEGEGLLGILVLGKHLGLTSHDILQEYDRKYRINIARQSSGY